ncbi:hypothetical protein [Streptomyces sp. G-G2]|uniref:hypothetical protein n=1 Tax=Streptomyces sp. G-G2 TaxID=3046201 RepID=UPI0024B9E023|nr:hypothetical protein [Streptomyces sp. G-G2]MDJ0382819.1 hypothetical protein [Streptomyces sp. G-G2]
MSFGDPNNPYGQQQPAPQGGQPGYGYPQQAPQGVPPQGGYGYPQGGAPAYPGGYSGAPMTMPGGVSGARVMLFVIGALQVIGAVIFAIAGGAIDKAKNDPSVQADSQFDALKDFPTGALYGFAVAILLWGVFAIVLGAKFGKGGNGVRITAIVFGSITALLGIYPFILIGLVHTILAILIIVFVAKADGAAWFNRPKHV